MGLKKFAGSYDLLVQLFARQNVVVRWLVCLLFVVWVLAQLVYVLLPSNLELPANFLIVFLFASFSFLHMALLRGWFAAWLLLGLCFVVAGGLEVLSVGTGFPFGRYVYSQAFGPSVAGVSLLVPVCWFMMAYPALCLAELILAKQFSFVAVVVVAACALTAWDLFLDPQMVRFGHWVWSEPVFYAGVPLINYFGWLFTSLIVFFVFYKVVGLPKQLHNSLPSLFNILPVLAYVWTWFGLMLVNAVWWNQAVVALVGGVGMGLFAVPALWFLRKVFVRNLGGIL